ncbi:histidine phosphatase superfamily [Mariannaea sp. PMI_226]|nr:histidine phosphatase superfamily [Mariannaea sp. PMI_226]
MARLFLVRHGETVDNVAGLYAGSRDSPLTAHGVLQARRLASHLAGTTLTHIFSSDLQRAAHTAEAICNAQKRARETDLTVVQKSELREKHFGAGEGTKLGSRDHHGAETSEAMRSRVEDFLDHLVSLLKGDSVVCIVAHGIILGVLFRALAARSVVPHTSTISPRQLWWSNTGYLEAVLSLSPLKLLVDKVNCLDHVKGLKKTRGGIGSVKFDTKQKTMDSFFKPTSKKRKLG